MATHAAIFTVAPRAPLEMRQVPTPKPGPGEIRLHVQYTASSPLDLHVADGWLNRTKPGILGGGYAGDVVEVGEGVTSLAVGDQVFGFAWATDAEHSHQTYAVVPAWMCGKVPTGVSLQQAVVVPANLTTIFQAAFEDLHLDLPWPRPDGFVPENADKPVLIWGGSASVGMYAIQVFKRWGYKKILVTASKRHHEMLKGLGADELFDYREAGVEQRILDAAGGRVPFVFDCVGHKSGTVRPISKIAVHGGDRVAIVLPVIIKDASATEAPEYAMDPSHTADWADGVVVKGIRAHFYPNNALFKEKMQPEIVPALVADGTIKPNPQRIVEGATMLDRAQKALDILRSKDQSGERLVWRVADE